MTAADFPMVQRWLAKPHVAEWWGDPHVQCELLRADLEYPAMEHFVISLDDRPFAFIQCYDPTAWPDHGFGQLPAGTRGIDQFIGDPDMIGRGYGSAFVRNFVDDLLRTGSKLVLTDPSPANTRAIRAYEKAGFRKDRPVATPDGPALLMARES